MNIYKYLRKQIQGTYWTKDILQQKLYQMETSQENPKSPTLRNRTEFQKLKDEWNYTNRYENEIENREIEKISQLDSLTEITGGTIKYINEWINKIEENKKLGKQNLIDYILGYN
ncbi:MAG: hypothetical protein ACP5N1_06010 [Candidatus Woesearchaeota archaeon]